MKNAMAMEFLNKLATITGLPRDELSITVELRNGGPTVSPPSTVSADVIRKKVEGIGRDENSPNGPHGHYDTLQSNHLEISVIHTVTEAGVSIRRTIYAFQHHPMAGCCRFGLNRWVRNADPSLPAETWKAGLDFRLKLAKHYGCSTLYVTSGRSFNGGDLYGDFTKIYTDEGGRSIYALPTG